MRYLCPLIMLAECIPGGMAAAQAPADHAFQWFSLSEHPRPDWARRAVSLNGPWRFDLDPDDVGISQGWFREHAYRETIQVPFPWQSRLSGIHRPDYQGVVWYERDITIPADLNEPRTFIVFGAVDWHATVWVNGRLVTRHEGGYTPFEVELTDFGKPGETVRVTVRAYDVTDPETPNGKQTGWYTPTGGIWQTVYLEGRGDAYLTKGHVTPDVDGKRAVVDCEIQAASAGEYRVEGLAWSGIDSPMPSTGALQGAVTVTCKPGRNQVQFVVNIPEPKLWSPETPDLYVLKLSLFSNQITLTKEEMPTDTVQTYFGMRKVSRGVYENSPHEYILLNDKPVYLRGALHQSFTPEGLYTHPDDDYIRRDYEKAKAFGFNFIRIHIKIDEPRALYWADRLGVLLMCDMPCFNKKTDRAKALWEQTMRETVARDFNHPSIFSWCNFNETWGIADGGYDQPTAEWVIAMYRLTKSLDPTRLVEDNSPCNYDHVETDINSWHFYIDHYERAKSHIEEVVEKTYPGSTFNYLQGYKQGTMPLINSEYGGVGAGSGDRDVGWCFLYLTNLLRRHDKICGYVYTELEDIEWEHNGFMNYDRSDKVFPYPADITLAELQGADFPVIDGPPYRQINAKTQVSIPLFLSHWSEKENLSVRISAAGTTLDGKPWADLVASVERPVTAKPFAVTALEPIAFTTPDAQGLLNVVVEVLHDGARIGANYCVLDVRGGAVWQAPNTYVGHFTPASFSGFEFPVEAMGRFSPKASKVYGYGHGAIEYTLQMPADLPASSIAGCRLVVECGAKADRELVDWPERVHAQDYPQTQARTWPSDMVLKVNGVPATSVRLENDFADAAGVLSHVTYIEHGSHGQLLDIAFEGAALDAIKGAVSTKQPVVLRFEVPTDAKAAGGLAIYGANMGMWPSDPTLVFSLAPGSPRPQHEVKALNPYADRLATLVAPGPKGQTWRYTTQAPSATWAESGFDDSRWETGQGGFGRDGTPGLGLTTPWGTSDIWLRAKVNVPADFGAMPVWLHLYHDEDVEVYVNGQPLVQKRGHVSDYQRILLSSEQLGLFRKGELNTVAVHCQQTGGGQGVDLGLITLKKP